MLLNLDNLYRISTGFQCINLSTEELRNCLDPIKNMKFLRDLSLNFKLSILEKNLVVYLSEIIE